VDRWGGDYERDRVHCLAAEQRELRERVHAAEDDRDPEERADQIAASHTWRLKHSASHTWRLKHSASHTWRLKHSASRTWRLKHSASRTWRLKHSASRTWRLNAPRRRRRRRA